MKYKNETLNKQMLNKLTFTFIYLKILNKLFGDKQLKYDFLSDQD
ncbi:MAG: hypothetical protein ACLTAI_14730 [Thomasclavelia sp.]